MVDYQPRLGDFIQLVLEGQVSNIDETTGAIRIGTVATGSVSFKTTEPIVKAVERILPPEDWQAGDVVLAADGKVFRRLHRGTWMNFNAHEVLHHVPERPLHLLVRDGLEVD